MSDTRSRFGAARFLAELEALHLRERVRALPTSTRTAEQAAAAVGCPLGRIVKSLVFRTRDTARPVLVVASGENRVDEQKIADLLGEPIGKADADFVREHTGFVIGGVAPFAHPAPITTFIDRDLLVHTRVWTAAGSPNALLELTLDELRHLSGGRVADVKA